MAEYSSDSEFLEEDFEYDGRPCRFEPEYTDEELSTAVLWERSGGAQQ